MPRMRALRVVEYDGKAYVPGTEFDAAAGDAAILAGVGAAAIVDKGEPLKRTTDMARKGYQTKAIA